MIDWNKETANTNYCGYCIDFTCPCSGECFKDKRFDSEENKLHHVKWEIEKSNTRLKELKSELKLLNNKNK